MEAARQAGVRGGRRVSIGGRVRPARRAARRALDAFPEHQTALLDRDLALSRERLAQFRTFLEAHARVEEEALIPLWFERGGEEPGSTRALSGGEHAKLFALPDKIEFLLARLAPGDPGLDRALIGVFDVATTFKGLLDHHDRREANMLFPKAAALTTPEERAAILARFERAEQRTKQGG